MVQGTNYGLNDSLKYTEFEFDSLVAEQSLDSDYSTTDWPMFLLGKPLSNIAAVKVIECQIPFSYYVFNTINQNFLLTESDGGGATTITIPAGNYDSTTILAALATALNASSANSHTYTVTYSSLTQKLTFSSNAGGANTFTFTFGNVNNVGNTNPRLWLGFNASTITSSTSQVLVAPNVIQLTGANYLYICSRSLGPMVKIYLPQYAQNGVYGAGADGPQIAKVAVTSQPGGVTFWQDPAPLYWFDLENLTNLAYVDFYILIGTSNQAFPTLFNGNSFSIKIGFLTNESVHNDYLGGGKQNDRVTSRTWSSGAGMMQF